MPTLTLNGARLQIRLLEVEVRKLRLDVTNPRLHSAYLTHLLPAQPTQEQVARVLAQLPEFQSLKDALSRNEGNFQPPLVTSDLRVLEGNRRVCALRSLRAENTRQKRWESVTVQQLVKAVPDSQEKALRAKFHLEHMLPWDGLSQLTEFTAVAEREGADFLAMMLGRFTKHIEPLLVAGRCVRLFSQTYPDLHSQELLWVLVGLCGVKQLEPHVTFSRTQRCIFTDDDQQRPAKQPFPLAKVMSWLVEGRFTRRYEDGERERTVQPAKVPALFRRIRLDGEETLSYFLEPEGSLAKALSFMESGYDTVNRQQKRALNLTHKYMELLNQLSAVKREDNPDLYRDAMACYHRLEQLLGATKRAPRKEKINVHAH